MVEEGSTFSITLLITAFTFSNKSWGSCSYHPGFGLINAISWVDDANISTLILSIIHSTLSYVQRVLPACLSNNNARTLVVPTSNATTNVSPIVEVKGAFDFLCYFALKGKCLQESVRNCVAMNNNHHNGANHLSLLSK